MFHSRNYGDYSLKKDKCIIVDVRQFGAFPNCPFLMNNLHNFSNETCISQIFFHEKQKRLYCIWEWSLAKGTRRRVENLHVMLWIIHALLLSHVQIIQKMSVNSKTSAPPHVSFSKEKKIREIYPKNLRIWFFKMPNGNFICNNV